MTSFIPFKDYLTGRFVSDKNTASSDSLAIMRALGGTDGVPDRSSFELSLDIREIGYEYTIVARKDSTGKLPEVAPWTIDRGEFKRKAIGHQEQSAQPIPGKKVSVSGTIVIPEDEQR